MTAREPKVRALVHRDRVPELVAAARAVGVPLDGHTLGMIGEAHAARLLELRLAPCSTEGYDALDRDGRRVEIKATTRRTVSLRPNPPDLLAVLHLDPDTLDATVVYFGPAAPTWDLAGPAQKNGTRALSFASLERLRLNSG